MANNNMAVANAVINSIKNINMANTTTMATSTSTIKNVHLIGGSVEGIEIGGYERCGHDMYFVFSSKKLHENTTNYNDALVAVYDKKELYAKYGENYDTMMWDWKRNHLDTHWVVSGEYVDYGDGKRFIRLYLS